MKRNFRTNVFPTDFDARQLITARVIARGARFRTFGTLETPSRLGTAQRLPHLDSSAYDVRRLVVSDC